MKAGTSGSGGGGGVSGVRFPAGSHVRKGPTWNKHRPDGSADGALQLNRNRRHLQTDPDPDLTLPLAPPMILIVGPTCAQLLPSKSTQDQPGPGPTALTAYRPIAPCPCPHPSSCRTPRQRAHHPSDWAATAQQPRVDGHFRKYSEGVAPLAGSTKGVSTPRHSGATPPPCSVCWGPALTGLCMCNA